MQDPRRSTPRTDTVLADPRLQEATARLGLQAVKVAVNHALDLCRSGQLAPEDVADTATAVLSNVATSLRPVINATGIIVHTNLGRAPLSAAALDAVRAAGGATDVEMDLVSGRRDRRGHAVLSELAAAVPDAEAVHVVNNGTAALALTACALAQDKNVIISRGELVEIGDGFRIPELLVSVGAELREVGTTNRVRADDYTNAIDGSTAFILKVHPSNFVVTGFTSEVGVGELASLDVPVVADIGSGLLSAHRRLPDEPDAASTLRSGASLVTASGDKLLGGPQCGLVFGRQGLVEVIRRHPLARAMRVDKLTLAALEATLTGPPTPVSAALATKPEGLLDRAEQLARQLTGLTDARAVTSLGAVGGGGAPGVELDSAALSLPACLAEPLRTSALPVVGRIQHGRLLLDLIAVSTEEDPLIIESVRSVLAGY